MFTSQQQAEYKYGYERLCPWCGSNKIASCNIHVVDNAKIVSDMVCDSCLELWSDIYLFDHMEATDD